MNNVKEVIDRATKNIAKYLKYTLNGQGKSKIKIIIFMIFGIILLLNLKSEKTSKSNSGKGNIAYYSIMEENNKRMNFEQENNNESREIKQALSGGILDNYQKDEEKRVKEFVESFKGVNKAKVLISYECSNENVLAKDVSYQKNKNENATSSNINDEKTNISINKVENTVMSNDKPYIVKTNMPKTKGVIILISGKYDINLSMQIREAMKAYLNLPINRIQVYEMKE